jgi:hypothetical protein
MGDVLEHPFAMAVQKTLRCDSSIDDKSRLRLVLYAMCSHLKSDEPFIHRYIESHPQCPYTRSLLDRKRKYETLCEISKPSTLKKELLNRLDKSHIESFYKELYKNWQAPFQDFMTKRKIVPTSATPNKERRMIWCSALSHGLGSDEDTVIDPRHTERNKNWSTLFYEFCEHMIALVDNQ